ncbi:MAG: NAD(P)-dependent oxidoreductase [Chloroflexi bacterium]|uniref:NAD(P)-dependent oxidoreductase n=1 Tax=Candidatus Chlorohelix allophototropha TaxID=3003348 RepID=A0A8T7M8G0_9CHLR|nr:NAD(P)-dependent oxidoreductase [Chloroflexota bacterium]WJW68333.1 NAD(P)-dependent oxidoreductase [Chloroflexota bacterium L227-S17]
MKTIAITGVTGFIGSKLAEYFAERGYRLIGFGRREPLKPALLERYIHWDITEGALQLDEEVDVVLHCAGNVSDWDTHEVMYRVNVEGTRNVLETFKKARQFVYVSTASVYDLHHNSSWLTEDAPYPQQYLNAYATTKMEAEMAIKQYGRTNAVIVRPHIVYGPGDTSILPRLLEARRFGRFLVVGDGSNLLSITYIENFCRAIDLIIQRDFEFEIFNLADAYTGTVNEILAAFKQSLNFNEKMLHIDKRLALLGGTVLEKLFRLLRRKQPPLITPFVVAQMASGYRLDISKACAMLGYCPEYDFYRGFEELKKWLDNSNSADIRPLAENSRVN